MFVRMRNRLTLLYSGLLMLFLIAFIVIVYMLFSYVLLDGREEAAIQLVKEEFQEHTGDLIQWDREKTMEQIDHNAIELDPHERLFYYLISADGTLLHGDEAYPDMRKVILNRIEDWRPQINEIRYETFHSNNNQESHEIHILFAGRSLFQNGDYLGTIYVGADVSEEHKSIERLIRILLVIAFVFLVLSSVFGYYMAGRTMRPIVGAYTRQREFVADASHELRTPLSVIRASIEVIEAEEKENLSSFSKQIIADMKDESERMTHLVNDLLALARADSGSIELVKKPFDLYKVLDKLVRTVTPVAQQKEVTIQLTGLSQLNIIADEERIKQLFYILLDNALKFTQKGGRIEISLDEVRKGNQRKVKVIVTDTGEGISKEQLTRIFDRFYRVDTVRTRSNGTGLGLSIAKWIVDAHHGTIQAESEVNAGTSFTILLPIIGKDE